MGVVMNRAAPLLLVVVLALPLAACDGGEPASASSANAADRDTERILAEIRRVEVETKKLVLKQQELSRHHLEDVSEDLQFQMGKVLQRMNRLEENVAELMWRINKGGGGGIPTAEEAAAVQQYTDEMRQEVAKKVAERGVILKEDRAEIAGYIGPGREAPLEFFAVLRGGKEHEALVILTGAYGKDERLPRGLAAGINLACQALNLPRGTPARWLEGGKEVPAKGDPVHVYVEWKDGDETVRARAEDLVFNETTNKAMTPETWIYTGSRFLMNMGTGQRDFMAEITGSIAATFGDENSILANKSPEATDVNQANFFRGYTPRVPAVETPVVLVISREPLEVNAKFAE
jgi:hypothetical protein